MEFLNNGSGFAYSLHDFVGSYDNHGFIYNMTTQNWTTIDVPGATYTRIYGIDGSNLELTTWNAINFLKIILDYLAQKVSPIPIAS